MVSIWPIELFEPASRQGRTDVAYPTLKERYLSTLIDLVVLAVFVVVLTVSLQGSGRAVTVIRVALGFLVIVNYEPVLTSKACTIGQAIVGIRVRSFRDRRQRVSLGRAYLRMIVKLVLGVYSFFAMGFNRERRAVHDFASGTVVLAAQEPATAQASPGAR